MESHLQALAEQHEFGPEIITSWTELLNDGIDANFLSAWLETFDNSKDLILLTEILTRLVANGKSQKDLNRWIDNSPFSISDWAAAALTFFKKKGDSVPPDQTALAFGYLTCCAETATYLPNLESFREIVEQMLNFYGYDGRPGDHRSGNTGAHC